MASPRPSARVSGLRAYTVPRHPAPLVLDLRGNEGASPDPALLHPPLDPALPRAYPDARPLEAALAAAHGLAPEQVIVTAGGDDALDRVARATLEPGRAAVLPWPGFEMTARYIRLAGGAVREVPWPGAAFPTAAVCAATGADVGLVVVTSPNNPTGAVATAADLRAVHAAAAAVGALVLVDLAYAEFADEDLTAEALALGCVVVRTFSKAWGLAGLRVGWAAGPAECIGWLRAAGAPYAVSAPSLALATRALERGDGAARAFAAGVRAAREALNLGLEAAGLDVLPSQANFAFARGPRVPWIVDAMAALGVGVRAFPDRPELHDAVRVACPPDAAGLSCALVALHTAARPEALLFDMDGVLADVSQSYRAAIVGAAAAFGVPVSAAQISAMKAQGDANNDWVLTWRLLRAAGVEAPLAAVTEVFEALYQGTPEAPGLWATERLLCAPALLERLAARLPLAVVTGRPRHDAQRFLQHFGLTHLFGAVVCMEDGPLKPDPAPVQEALRRLGVGRAWLVGDTVDDLRAARAAGVVPIGVPAPGERDATPLRTAARVLTHLDELEELLP